MEIITICVEDAFATEVASVGIKIGGHSGTLLIEKSSGCKPRKSKEY
jgi:hypothetical protein